IAALLGWAIPSKICDLSECVSIARTITGTPPSMSDAVTDGNWDAPDPAVQKWLNLGKERLRVCQPWLATVKPDSDQQDWQEVLSRRTKHSRSILRILRPSWHADSKRICSVMVDGKLLSITNQL